MQTRYEKYKDYREQIKKKGMVFNQLTIRNKKIGQYIKKIDKIDPTIKKSFKPTNQYLLEVIYIDNTDLQKHQEIKNLWNIMEELDLKFIIDKSEDVLNWSEIEYTYKKDSGIVHENILEGQGQYKKVISLRREIASLYDKINAFPIESKHNLAKLNQLVINVNQTSNVDLPKVQNDVISDTKDYNHFYRTLVALLIILLVIGFAVAITVLTLLVI